jgi:hypothetical protein
MKITVVVMAPYSVVLESGRHLATGEIAQVEKDEYVESCINSGKLGLVEIAEPPAPPAPAKPPAVRKPESDSSL